MFHRAHVPSCPCSIVPMFHRVYFPLCLCAAVCVPLFLCVHVPSCPCSIVFMFHRVHVPSCPCSIVPMFHRVYFLLCLCAAVCVPLFHCVHVLLCPCSIESTFHCVYGPSCQSSICACVSLCLYHTIFMFHCVCIMIIVYLCSVTLCYIKLCLSHTEFTIQCHCVCIMVIVYAYSIVCYFMLYYIVSKLHNTLYLCFTVLHRVYVTLCRQYTVSMFHCLNRLVGLVVRRPPRERKVPGSNPACDGIFSRSSHTCDLNIGTPVATLPGAWRYRVSAGTGRSGVCIL